MEWFSLRFLFFGLFLVFCVTYLYKEDRKQDMRLKELRKILQVQTLGRIEAIEVGLEEWLEMLKLPQLAEKKKRQEAARQLRIVLVEQLMNGPKVR